MLINLPEMNRIPLYIAYPGQVVQGSDRRYIVQTDGSWRKIEEKKMKSRRVKQGKKVGK